VGGRESPEIEKIGGHKNFETKEERPPTNNQNSGGKMRGTKERPVKDGFMSKNPRNSRKKKGSGKEER